MAVGSAYLFSPLSSGGASTDIPQMTSKFVEIVPLVHRQGNSIPLAPRVTGIRAMDHFPMSAFGYKRTLWDRASNVRFTPNSRHQKLGVRFQPNYVCSTPNSGH